jgi:hypothetical protein
MSEIIPSHWGHQTHFRVAAQVLAQSIFDELDVSLRPNVFLIGLVADHDRDLYPLFVDAKGHEYSPTLFATASARAREIRQQLYKQAEEAKEGTEATKEEEAEGNRKRKIVLDAWRQAVEEVLTQKDEQQEMISFCAPPRPVEKFLVCTVLQLNRRAWGAYYTLPHAEGDRLARRPASLLDAAVSEYMKKCAVGLAERHAGLAAGTLDYDHEEILRSSGRMLADSPALDGAHDLSLQGLFHACNTISSMRYEGEAGLGRLLIAPPAHRDLEVRLSLRAPVRLHDYIAVRKLLQTCGAGFSLLSDGAVVHGVGNLRTPEMDPKENVFLIRFLKHYTWEIAHGGHVLMRVTYGHPRLPRVPILEHRFRLYLTRAFGLLDMPVFLNLWELALAASEQKHGTILVISQAAASEAKRLEKQSTPIDPIRLTPDVLKAVTSIDGAVLIDPAGVCHAIGVILDGRASTKGNPGRGARYNSAQRYADSSEDPCLAVVVSEDGGVDLLCK